MLYNIIHILFQIGSTTEKAPREFYVFFIISTIVVHAIVIAILYFVFRDFFRKKEKEEREKKRLEREGLNPESKQEP